MLSYHISHPHTTHPPKKTQPKTKETKITHQLGFNFPPAINICFGNFLSAVQLPMSSLLLGWSLWGFRGVRAGWHTIENTAPPAWNILVSSQIPTSTSLFTILCTYKSNPKKRSQTAENQAQQKSKGPRLWEEVRQGSRAKEATQARYSGMARSGRQH